MRGERLGARREWPLEHSGVTIVARVPDPNYGKERLWVRLEWSDDPAGADAAGLTMEIAQYDVLAAARALTEAYEWAYTDDYLSDEWDEMESEPLQPPTDSPQTDNEGEA